eukprot:2643890-Rhodomonas_salina.1
MRKRALLHAYATVRARVHLETVCLRLLTGLRGFSRLQAFPPISHRTRSREPGTDAHRSASEQRICSEKDPDTPAPTSALSSSRLPSRHVAAETSRVYWEFASILGTVRSISVESMLTGLFSSLSPLLPPLLSPLLSPLFSPLLSPRLAAPLPLPALREYFEPEAGADYGLLRYLPTRVLCDVRS